MSGIRSKKHKLVTYTSNKMSISCFDDKRYILFDGINTLPYGHKDIQKINSNYQVLINIRVILYFF